MAVKSAEKKATEKEVDVKATPKTEAVSKKKPTGTGGFCVYIGPTIRGVIQSNTIYPGSKQDVEKRLEEAIEKYPLIAKLISNDKTFAEDRIKVNTAGNVLNVYYKKLVAGKSN